jgi:hypothetical protein
MSSEIVLTGEERGLAVSAAVHVAHAVGIARTKVHDPVERRYMFKVVNGLAMAAGSLAGRGSIPRAVVPIWLDTLEDACDLTSSVPDLKAALVRLRDRLTDEAERVVVTP